MKFIILVLVALLAVAYATEEPIPIVRYEQDTDANGSYYSSYKTGNGISAHEHGVLKNAGTKDEAEEVKGSFKWTAPDGQIYSVKYIANENGFQPQGAHIPVAPEPPPIPDYILRSLEYNAAHPEQEE